MRILKNSLKIITLIVAALSFSANAMHTDFFTKSNVKHIAAPRNSVGVDTTIYVSVDTAPHFPGGLPAFMVYLSTNLKYPAADKEKRITGKVYAVFVIEQDGSLSNIKAVRSPSDAMTAEATRVLASSPKWVPGQMNGKTVRVQYTLPINFELPK